MFNTDVSNQANFITRTRLYFQEKQSFTDYQKLVGYIQSVRVVSASGYLGNIIGVGPTNFASSIGMRRGASLITAAGFDAESLGALSAATSKKTDYSVILGEIGLLGGGIFLFLIVYMLYTTISKIKFIKEDEEKIFSIFLATWLGFMIIMTLYTEGWLWNQFAIVSIIFLVYDHKFIKPSGITT